MNKFKKQLNVATSEYDEKKLRHNEIRRKVPSYKDKRSIAIHKSCKQLMDNIAHKHRLTKMEAINNIVIEYAKQNDPELYEELKHELDNL